MEHPRTIVITGASSGIGAALAKAYAAQGVVLGLCGRNELRLNHVRDICAGLGATVVLGIADVTDEQAMRKWLLAFDAAHPVDLLIANAGIAAGRIIEEDSEAQLRDIFAVNLGGTINSIMPIIPRMQLRKRGQIALMSSLAGIRGLPSCPAYSASKAAVRYFGEGLRGSLKADGINVSVICPGFIKTPLTDANAFPMPLIMSAERAALIIRKGLTKNRGRIAFPRLLYWPLWWLSCLSPAITDRFFAALPAKNAMQKT